MSCIKVEKDPTLDRLESLDALSWPIWTKEVSEFPWEYSSQEVCYFLEGEVIVTPDDGEPVIMGKGNLVTFPVGMKCTWNVLKDVKKHYKFG